MFKYRLGARQILRTFLLPSIPLTFLLPSLSSVNPREAHLEPGQSCQAIVSCLMDDARDFKDVLHVS